LQVPLLGHCCCGFLSDLPLLCSQRAELRRHRGATHALPVVACSALVPLISHRMMLVSHRRSPSPPLKVPSLVLAN
jgi:hypothetical protein